MNRNIFLLKSDYTVQHLLANKMSMLCHGAFVWIPAKVLRQRQEDGHKSGMIWTNVLTVLTAVTSVSAACVYMTQFAALSHVIQPEYESRLFPLGVSLWSIVFWKIGPRAQLPGGSDDI